MDIKSEKDFSRFKQYAKDFMRDHDYVGINVLNIVIDQATSIDKILDCIFDQAPLDDKDVDPMFHAYIARREFIDRGGDSELANVLDI